MEQANVLIADSEPQMRLDLRRLLTEIGYRVAAEAEQGEQVLALARARRPDAVVLDAALSRPSGLEVARALLAERLTPVVLTGRTDAALVRSASEAGVLAFLAKPLRRQDLEPAIPIAIARFQELVALENEVRNLQARMEARRLVGRAKALLMERFGLPEREAFRRIQSQSLALGKPVHEIAQAIIVASEIAT